MKIIADSQIPFVQQAFSTIGEVTLYEGRNLSPQLISDADIMVIRSVTPVNQDLLENSRVKFVATATSGTDHVDTDYLQKTGIGFASAHGSNARSVVEYVLSSLFVLANQNDTDPSTLSAGIIGCGMVGSKLMSAFNTIGIHTIVNDPPLKDATGDPVYREFDEIINADIITLHVPLTDQGLYPTWHLIDEKHPGRMKRNAILINTSRGQVINEKALKGHLATNRNFSAVLDVWENEPDIDLDLLKYVAIGTPHIAGYSVDAKTKATEMIYAEVCNYFNIQQIWKPSGNFVDIDKQEIRIGPGTNDIDAIMMVVLSHYDVRSDAVSLRRALEIDKNKTGYFFDELRKNYPVRRGFSATTVSLPAARTILAEKLKSLGFNITWH